MTARSDTLSRRTLLRGIGGTIRTGRVLDFTKRGEEDRKLCGLYLSLLDKMGVPLKRFGDADRSLAEI